MQAIQGLYRNTARFQIAVLQDDKGGEYMSKEFEDFCIKHQIARCHTVHNWPQQNGVGEQFNCTHAEQITAMLHE
jgi:transposase InsO family protein